ncbi:MAG: hypothetical protein HY332_25995 [Chloroflexi bacterium]|nr:hypothetical protein [Chloroflexota bacterium]
MPRMRRPWILSLVVALVAPLAASMVNPAAVPAASAEPLEITGGRHFTEAGGGTGRGFDVRDHHEAAFGEAQFWSAIQALGDVDVAGYPASRPFSRTDGCVYQLTQAVALQSCPGAGVRLANTFEILEKAGRDAWLYAQKQIPRPIADDGSTSFEEAVQIRLGWLTNPEIGDRFFRAPHSSVAANWTAADAINLYGLPMSRPEGFGPFIAQRFQRIAFQLWTEDVPGMPAPGTVVAVLGGDLLKQSELVAGLAVEPHAAGESLRAAAPVALGDWPTSPALQAPRVAQPPLTAQPAQVPLTSQALLTAQQAQPTPQVPQASQAQPPQQAQPMQPALAVRRQPLAHGFQADLMAPAARPKAITLTKEAGFGWLKQQVIWSQYELRPGSYDPERIKWLDGVVDEVHRGGLKLFLSVTKAPDFYAASAAPLSLAPGSPLFRNPTGPASPVPAKLGDFLRYLAGRYRGKVQAYQTWNEPNMAVEWAMGPLWPDGPRDFVRLQKHAYEGVKAGDPGALVVFPALTPTGVGECDTCDRSFAIDERVYLDQVYQVNGGEIRRYFDVLGTHPYGYNNPPGDWSDVKTVPTTSFKVHPSFYFKRFTQLRDVMLKHGDDKPVWFSEFGWSACFKAVPAYEYCRDNSEADQARYLVEAFAMVRSSYPYVTNMFVWNLNFQMVVTEHDQMWGFAVVRGDGSPRPAFTALKAMVK